MGSVFLVPWTECVGACVRVRVRARPNPPLRIIYSQPAPDTLDIRELLGGMV